MQGVGIMIARCGEPKNEECTQEHDMAGCPELRPAGRVVVTGDSGRVISDEQMSRNTDAMKFLAAVPDSELEVISDRV